MKVIVEIDLPNLPEPDGAKRAQMNTFLHGSIRDFCAQFNSRATGNQSHSWGMMKPFGSLISYGPDHTEEGA